MEKYSPNFYDVSEIVYKKENGFCNKNEIINISKNKNLLIEYIKNINCKEGDILFLGGEDRLEYSFKIIGENYDLLEGNDPSYILFNKKNENFVLNIKDKISYKRVLKQLYEDEYFNDIFFGNYDEINILYNKVVSFFKEKGIY
jgi:hypothetical protein